MPALDHDRSADDAPLSPRGGRLLPLRSLEGSTTDSLETEDMLSLPEPEPERRGFERHDVWEANIAVNILVEGSDLAQRGRVRNMSLNGMWVDTAYALPFKSRVQAEWSIEGGLSRKFSGRVVRSAQAGMAVQLDTDDPTWRFRTRFVELATEPNRPTLSMTVQVDRRSELETAQTIPNDLAKLYGQWQQIERDLGNEGLHQAFIHACLQARRLEYALERYRELRMLRPGLPSIERYLKQIGTILSFCTLKTAPSSSPEPALWKKVAIAAVAIVVFAGGASLIAQRFAAMEQERAVVVESLRDADPVESLRDADPVESTLAP